MGAVLADNRPRADAFPPVLETLPEEGMVILHRQAMRYLGISGEEFLCRWNAGEYAADPDQPGLMEVVMLLPLVQAQPASQG